MIPDHLVQLIYLSIMVYYKNYMSCVYDSNRSRVIIRL